MSPFFGRLPCTSGRLTRCALLALVWLAAVPALWSAGKTRHVFLLTTDGLRPEELFTGADPALLNKEHGGFKDDRAITRAREAYWRDTPEERRAALMPFFWRVIAQQGQVFGDAARGSIARVSNGKNFSYPGYNEMLVGWPDPGIMSNAEVPNRNVTVLEWLHAKPAFRGRVSAYSAWSVMRGIVNADRAGFPVMAGWRMLPLPPRNPREELLNSLIADTTRAGHANEVWDSFVFHAAVEQFHAQRPRAMLCSFLETDYWGHQGRYDFLLDAARRFDDYVRRLWELVQSQPDYAGSTTFVLTTDHGRGSAPVEWKSHGAAIAGSENIWLAVLGPDTPARGVRTQVAPVTQAQVAATIAALLGEDYAAAHPRAAPPVADAFTPPAAPAPAAVGVPVRSPQPHR